MRRAATVRVDVHLYPGDLARALREDVRRGLTSSPKELPPKWFYDDNGSRLFDEITRLPEYYLTEAERAILADHAQDIADECPADTLVELGSGTSDKTRILLDALSARGCLRRFVPFDVSEGVLRDAARRLSDHLPSVEVHAVVGDFERHLDRLPRDGRRLIAFLGSTIGNFPPKPRARFLQTLATSMKAGDALLIGFDLVKDVARMEAAYNDAAGVTAEFNRNVLRVINRELGANFDVERFEHVAAFDADRQWIEMKLESSDAQRVRVADLDLEVDFAGGERMRTEISAKFRREGIVEELCAAGLSVREMWLDDVGDFALALAER